MQYKIYKTREEAEQAAGADAVMQVDGGFQHMDWSDFHRRSRDEAEALHAGGWTSADKQELIDQYGIDEEHADLMIGIIEELEEEEKESE